MHATSKFKIQILIIIGTKFELEFHELNVRPQRGRMFIKHINYKHTTPLGSNNKKTNDFNLENIKIVEMLHCNI